MTRILPDLEISDNADRFPACSLGEVKRNPGKTPGFRSRFIQATFARWITFFAMRRVWKKGSSFPPPIKVGGRLRRASRMVREFRSRRAWIPACAGKTDGASTSVVLSSSRRNTVDNTLRPTSYESARGAFPQFASISRFPRFFLTRIYHSLPCGPALAWVKLPVQWVATGIRICYGNPIPTNHRERNSQRAWITWNRRN